MTSIPLVTSSPLILTPDEADAAPLAWWKLLAVGPEVLNVSMTAPTQYQLRTDPRHWRRRGRQVAQRLGRPLREYMRATEQPRVHEALLVQLEEHNPGSNEDHLGTVALAMLKGMYDYCARRLTGDPIDPMDPHGKTPVDAKAVGETFWSSDD